MNRPELTSERAAAKLWNRMLRLVRRGHLFSGLFALPWVVLYGVTAFLYNHPAYFPDHKTVHFTTSSHGQATSNALLIDPAVCAQEVVSSLKEQDGERFGQSLALDPTVEPRFARPAYANARCGNSEISVVINPGDGSGFFIDRQRNTPDRDFGFPDHANSPVESKFAPQIERGVRELLTAEGYAVDEVRFRSVPEIVFAVHENGRSTELQFVPVSSELKPAPEISWRHFALRLHTSHIYPGSLGARWFWAVCVDGMFACLLFWAVSGVLMWWQMRRLRMWGLVTVMLSLTCGGLLIMSMSQVILN